MTNETKQQDPDRTPPTAERQTKLEAAYQENIDAGDPPYKGVQIKTLGELEWIMQRRQWSGDLTLLKDMERPNFSGADFSFANLCGVVLFEAILSNVILEKADLSKATLSKVNLSGSLVIEANLSGAYLGEADLRGADLFRTDLSNTRLEKANLSNARLDGANLSGAYLGSANLIGTELNSANLSDVSLAYADLSGAQLSQSRRAGAGINATDLSNADLEFVNLSGVDLREANLSGTNLCGAIFDKKSRLDGIKLSDRTLQLADVIWGDANLVSVDWEPVHILGDELEARKARYENGNPKGHDIQLDDKKASVRAYRLLATALRNQGMNEEADRFAYRARLCQQRVFRYQGKRGRALWYRFLDFIAGHGYKPERTIIAYVSIISTFALIFWAVSAFWLTIPASHPLSWYEAIVLSFSSFHGRGFFPSGISTGDPLAVVAVFEAVFGLFIEISFIATFTQRYFGR